MSSLEHERGPSLSLPALISLIPFRERCSLPAPAQVKTTRLSSLLNAALGYVAEETSGFVDFDSVRLL